MLFCQASPTTVQPVSPINSLVTPITYCTRRPCWCWHTTKSNATSILFQRLQTENWRLQTFRLSTTLTKYCPQDEFPPQSHVWGCAYAETLVQSDIWCHGLNSQHTVARHPILNFCVFHSSLLDSHFLSQQCPSPPSHVKTFVHGSWDS